jgi:rubrerythrin
MGNIFAGSEIVELGIQIEKNGRDFYGTLAAQSKNPSAVKVFGYLAGEEEKHIAVFQKILEKTQRYEPPQVYAEEYLAYMSALAGEHIFTRKEQGKKAAEKISSDNEAVDTGIRFEKESIIFYEGMKKAVPDYDQKIVDELILQEQNHLVQLTGLKKNL